MNIRKFISRTLISALILIGAEMAVFANGPVKGIVKDADSGEPLVGVVVKVDDGSLWAVTSATGEYTLPSMSNGSFTISFEYLGYKTQTLSVTIKGDKGLSGINANLHQNSLALDEVVVTATQTSSSNTVRSLGRDALDHLQISNVSDISSLLPGGKVVNPDLTQDNQISLREGATDAGNASFSLGVQVDGVRLSNNASHSEMKGISTRTIATENIESVEVITGVPSAEYGDIGSGMVKINTKKGRTPWSVNLSVNPRTYMLSLAKGFELPEDGGVLNASLEWARSTTKLTSPYTSYSRGQLGLNYTKTFKNAFRIEVGGNANIGGMNSEDDPDAYSGEYKKDRDNAFRGSVTGVWLLNRGWITNLKIDASINYADNLSHTHLYNTSASTQPAVHSMEKGYFLADKLPLTYYNDLVDDSKEFDAAASLKYDWLKSWQSGIKNKLKAGVQWKANGNLGKGKYYLDSSTAATGYRPDPYCDYPFMHNLSAYVEDEFHLPIGSTSLDLTAGLRMENVFIDGSAYTNTTSFSPRFNAKFNITKNISIRGGWGISEKLPSFYVLYPEQQYRDIRTASFSYGNGQSSYVYYTEPYTIEYNKDLKWQRHNNSELGFEARFKDWGFSVVGFYNITENPYTFVSTYTPFAYNMVTVPSDYTMPANPQIKVDSQTGMVYLRGDDTQRWTPMEVKTTDTTFVKTTKQANGAPVTRTGVEFVMDFPQIKAIRTTFRLDAAYTYTKNLDNSLNAYYNSLTSHSDKSLTSRSYQYVGVYANADNGTSVYNGCITNSLDMNLTAITHIPQARIVITLRLEGSLVKTSQNLSYYPYSDTRTEYAFNVSESGTTPTGGSIYDGNSYTAIRPLYYIDLQGNMHEFTDAEASKAEFSNLILKSGNAYVFALDGYDPYFSANISVTKEIGKHVALSFFANNFTFSRAAVTSWATGVSTIFTPSFYYGLTCRLKF